MSNRLMVLYKYKVRDKYGKLSTGTIEGDSREAVARRIEGMGFFPINIEEVHEFRGARIIKRFQRVKLRDLHIFTRQFATLIRSGLPVLSALYSLQKEARLRYFRDIIGRVIHDVEGGSSLSEALCKYKNVFNDLYINTVKAGESAGTLDEVLERLSEVQEHELDIRARIRSATMYPFLATCFLIVGFIILVTFVIPRFVKIFQTLQIELPLPTLIIMKINFLVTRYGYIFGIISLLLIWSFYRFIRSKKGRPVWDKVKLRIPVIGPLVLKLIMSRFSRTMAILIKAGVPILKVLDISSETVGNTIISRAIDNIKASVNEGKGMAEPMRISGVFSPSVVQMVSIGEETGKIDELLFRVSEYYDREASYSIKNLTVLIEPILIVILACFVLLMALAIFLPIWNMYGAFVK